MRRGFQAALFLLVAALIAAGSGLFVVHYIEGKRQAVRDTTLSHAWMHHQLGLTSGQEAKLEPVEERFAVRRKEYSAEIDAANK